MSVVITIWFADRMQFSNRFLVALQIRQIIKIYINIWSCILFVKCIFLETRNFSLT